MDFQRAVRSAFRGRDEKKLRAALLRAAEEARLRNEAEDEIRSRELEEVREWHSAAAAAEAAERLLSGETESSLPFRDGDGWSPPLLPVEETGAALPPAPKAEAPAGPPDTAIPQVEPVVPDLLIPEPVSELPRAGEPPVPVVPPAPPAEQLNVGNEEPAEEVVYERFAFVGPAVPESGTAPDAWVWTKPDSSVVVEAAMTAAWGPLPEPVVEPAPIPEVEAVPVVPSEPEPVASEPVAEVGAADGAASEPEPEPAVPEPAVTAPVVAESVVPEPVVIEPAIPGPVAEVGAAAVAASEPEPELAVPESVLPEPVVAELAVPEPAVAESVAPEPVAIEPAIPGLVAEVGAAAVAASEPEPGPAVVEETEPEPVEEAEPVAAVAVESAPVPAAPEVGIEEMVPMIETVETAVPAPPVERDAALSALLASILARISGFRYLCVTDRSGQVVGDSSEAAGAAHRAVLESLGCFAGTYPRGLKRVLVEDERGTLVLAALEGGHCLISVAEGSASLGAVSLGAGKVLAGIAGWAPPAPRE